MRQFGNIELLSDLSPCRYILTAGCFQLQEGTEQCDCGTASICPDQDKCCNVFGDGNGDCELKSGSDCSPFHIENGRCCNETNCENKTGTVTCREETACTKISECVDGICPEADKFLEWTYCSATDKDKLCDDDGRCSRSLCAAFELPDVSCILSHRPILPLFITMCL